MSSYAAFAKYYDELIIKSVNYKARGDYLLSLFDKFGERPREAVDLACGSGRLMKVFAEKGIATVGVDFSEDMLSLAAARLCGKYKGIGLVHQDITKLNLGRVFDGAVSTLDGLNHLGSISEISSLFSRLARFIKPGGLFVFDMNTPYKHKNILANNSFVQETKNVVCVWQNEYHDRDFRVDISIDLFIPVRGGLWKRVHEEFSERAYDAADIMDSAQKNGFETLAVYDDMSFEPAHSGSERAVFVIKRKGM